MTKQQPSPKRSRPPAATGAERQHKYRTAKKLSSVAAVPEVLQRLAALRTQTGLTNTQILIAALDLFAQQRAAPGKSPHSQARSSLLKKMMPDPALASAPEANKASPHNENATSDLEQFNLLTGKADPVARSRRKR